MSKSFNPRPRAARFHSRTAMALALSALLFTQLLPIVRAVNLNTVETPVVEQFNIGTAATAALPADFRADKNVGRRVVGSYSTAGTATEQTAGGGSPTISAGGIYNCGSGTNNTGSDRAVGFLGSGSVNGGNLYAKYTNTTGAPITALRVSYDVEKYRNGTNAAGFRYQLFVSTTGASGSWVSAGANFLTAFAGPDLNNNSFATAPGATVSVSNQLLSLPSPVANNSDIYLAWNYAVTTGSTDTNAQLLAIDNISVTPLGGSVGTTGLRTTDIQGTDDGGYALALQPDGKIILGGYSVNNSGNKDFALVRYNYNGTLDTTFGGTGKVTTDFNNTSDRIWGITLQSDGKIVAVGETVSMVFPGTNDIAIARYTTAGVLDPTFGGTGKVTTDHGGGANNSAYAVAMSGTNIIVAGTENVSGNLDFMVARYTTAGVLDPTFGTLGVTTLGFSGGNDVARAVAIDSSSNILLGGYAGNGSDDDFAVARFTSAGALDTTFVRGAGKAAVDIFSGGSADQAFALAINPSNNTIILAGSAFNPTTNNKDFALARYNNAGALQGIETTDFNNSPDVAQALVITGTGVDTKVVAAGFSRNSTSSDDFALARYNTDGTLDTTFDGDGKLTMRINNADDRAYGVAQEFDGKLVAGGFATVVGSNPVQHDFALARFNSDGTLDSTNATSLNNPDLLVTVTGPQGPNSVIAGDAFTYNVTVENRGAVAATSVVLTDTLPAGVSYVGSTASVGTPNESGGVVTDNVGTLAPGATATLTINVTAGSTPALVTDTATATLSETDVSPSNNTASEYTRIIGLTDMSFSPSTVVGGCQNSTGTVTLSGDAPTGGATVTLSTADPAAQPPASVFVPAGQRTATFQVTTQSVAANKTVRMQADLGPTTFVRRLVVNAGQCN
jgi:uncharacterized delta-60 repeat protein/uncharacterized repeat protein (TIGR01451 family)